MSKQSLPIPDQLIAKTAHRIFLQRQKQGIEGTAETDWQEAVDYLEKNPAKVKRWYWQHRAIAAVICVERRLEDLVELLKRMAIFDILDFVGKAAIIVGVYSYFADAPERQKQAEYQAWQVINSAVGQKHSGGRKSALEDLKGYGVKLNGINLKNANLSKVNLQKVSLVEADLSGAILEKAQLGDATLWGANLKGAILWETNLENADLNLTNLQEAFLTYANLKNAKLTLTNLEGVKFWDVAEFQSLSHEQLQSSCFWDRGVQVKNQETGFFITIDPKIIEEAMRESPYDVEACTKRWNLRKAGEKKAKEQTQE